MPIHCPVRVTPLSAEEFEELDYRVMGHVYASQNELGRLCDECVYHADLQARLLADGFKSVQTEVPVTVTYKDFSKRFFLDLVADNALYELKAKAALINEDETQLYHYAFLLGIPRCKLLNFGASKVQGKILATGLTQERRRIFSINTERWQDVTEDCARLRQKLSELLHDWGAFLEVGLYQEALIHFLGGAGHVESRIQFSRGCINLGTQRMLIHTPGMAFRLTAVTEEQHHVESHLHRLLTLTCLNAIQWINMNHGQIEFRTLKARE